MANIVHTYYDLFREKSLFRRVDHEGMARFDNPAALYFKLAFYFSDDVGLIGCNGYDLEAESALEKEVKQSTKAFKDKGKIEDANEPNTSVKNRVYSNTALNYLLLNDELERAELLKQFISLLSSINCDSPWYFKEISGIDGALERKFFSPGEDFKIEDKPRQLTIKCMAEAYDNRIGTLLDLYRAICYSYQAKREVVPANLRKFNMAIMIFNAPVLGKGGRGGTKDNRLRLPQSGDENSVYIPSMKYIEFRNCEFDYNSSKSAWGTINAEEPLEPEYTITINYDDAYEVRYNEIMQKVITDFIMIDILPERKDDKLPDINAHGKSYNDTESLKLENGGPNAKWFWTNRNWEKGGPFNDVNENDIYQYQVSSGKSESRKMVEIADANNLSIFENRMKNGADIDKGGLLDGVNNMLASKAKGFGEKLSKLVEIPSFELRQNIHDKGTVNNLGTYEYLNRLTGMGGIVGNLTGQAAGAGVKALKDQVNKLFLGNIHGTSVADIMSKANQVLSGDISGMIGKSVKDSAGRKNDYEGDLSGDIFPDVEKMPRKAAGKIHECEVIRDIAGANGKIHEGEVADISGAGGDIFPDVEKKDTVATGKIHEGEIADNGRPAGDIFPEVEKTDFTAEGILPQHDYKRTSWIGKYNEAKSIYNNL